MFKRLSAEDAGAFRQMLESRFHVSPKTAKAVEQQLQTDTQLLLVPKGAEIEINALRDAFSWVDGNRQVGGNPPFDLKIVAESDWKAYAGRADATLGYGVAPELLYREGDKYFFTEGTDLPVLPKGLTWESTDDMRNLGKGVMQMEYRVALAQPAPDYSGLKLGSRLSVARDALPPAPAGLRWVQTVEDYGASYFELKPSGHEPRSVTVYNNGAPPPPVAGFKWEKRGETEIYGQGTAYQYVEVPVRE